MTISSDPLIDLTLRFALALVFAGAAISKLQNADEFHGVVRNFRLLPRAVDGVFAFTLPWVELALAASLVTGFGLAAASATAAALLAVFAIAIAINIARGRTEIDCGCFRQGLRQSLSWTLVLRNGALVAAALWIGAELEWPRTAQVYDVVIAALAALSGLVLYLSATELTAIRRLPLRGRSIKEGWSR
jgi:uncharacterized membrane protein YphA (DoxX/SURF4 family)